MTATVFDSREPDLAINPADAPMVVANPAMARRQTQAWRKSALMYILPAGVLALAAAGVIAIVSHHAGVPATNMVATPTDLDAPAPVAAGGDSAA